MRLRRYGVQPYVPDYEYKFQPHPNRFFTMWGAKHEAEEMNKLVQGHGYYKIRYKGVRL